MNDLEYTFKSFETDTTVHIKKGFKFDGASIPRIFYIIGTPMGGDTLIAALFHDKLYCDNSKLENSVLTRSQCDQCFNELMILCKVKFWKRILFYLGVRIWGWTRWLK